ncbi:uncharacterized protein LOC127736830 [Mytilus californianus]|uniref:uncharacterized protein LOC127736830 n=1 Tax=Mytilus californianus TaxID=6549 RepID=UPI002247DD57|nr:uncharacterized protein LOC127736830 [Mytilus californianus]
MTHNDIRYVNNTCYHTNWICSPNICSCSESCKSFTWNVTVKEDMKNHSYSCVTRMVTGEAKYLGNITVKWNGNDGFQTLQKIVVPVDIVTRQPTTPKSDSVKWIIISITVGSVTCICVFIVLSLKCRKICRSKRHKAPQGSETEIPIYVIPDQSHFSDQQNSRNKPSNDQNINYKHNQAPKIRQNPSLHVHTPKNRHKPDDFRFWDFRPSTTNLKQSTTTSYNAVRYSPLPGHRNSTRTENSASGEGERMHSVVNYQNIQLGNTIDESNA